MMTAFRTSKASAFVIAVLNSDEHGSGADYYLYYRCSSATRMRRYIVRLRRLFCRHFVDGGHEAIQSTVVIIE